MKRLLISALVLIFLFALCACVPTEQPPTNGTPNIGETGGQAPDGEQEPADETEQTPVEGQEAMGGIDTVNIYCGNNKKTIVLADNKSARAFAERLGQGDVVVEMNDYGNFEKVGGLGFSLPQTNEQITTSAGDVILYLGNQITVYYATNSWNFTRLGKIEGMTTESMLDFFGGKGKVSVKFSLN